MPNTSNEPLTPVPQSSDLVISSDFPSNFPSTNSVTVTQVAMESSRFVHTASPHHHPRRSPRQKTNVESTSGGANCVGSAGSLLLLEHYNNVVNSSSSTDCIEVIASPHRSSARPHSAAAPLFPKSPSGLLWLRQPYSSSDALLSPSCLSCPSMMFGEEPQTDYSPPATPKDEGDFNPTTKLAHQPEDRAMSQLPPFPTALESTSPKQVKAPFVDYTCNLASLDQREDILDETIKKSDQVHSCDPSINTLDIHHSSDLLSSLPWNVLSQSVFEYLDVRDIYRLSSCSQYLHQNISRPVSALKRTESISQPDASWEIWDTTQKDDLILSPTQFQNRPTSFFDCPEIFSAPGSDEHFLMPALNHFALGGWWNSLSPKQDLELIKLLSACKLRKIRVESEFYDCICPICRDVSALKRVENIQPVQRPNVPEFPTEGTPSRRHGDPTPPSPFSLGEPSNLPLAPSPAPLGHRHRAFLNQTENSARGDHQLLFLGPPLGNIGSSDDHNGDPTLSQIEQNNQMGSPLPFYVDEALGRPQSFSPERRLRRLSPLDEDLSSWSSNNIEVPSQDEVPNQNYNGSDELTSSSTFDPASFNNNEDLELPPLQKKCPMEHLAIAKRHVSARFFWVFRLMLLSRDSLETMDFGTPHSIFHTLCDDGPTLPDFPLNLRFYDQHFVFPKLRSLRFGITIDCRFIVPIVDFCKYSCLKEVEILGLSLRYEMHKSQFGEKPTMVFGPQQIFTAAEEAGRSPLWLPALYNGGTDEGLQLQERGVYASREYHYEGTFKDGRNDGFGRMTSKCGETCLYSVDMKDNGKMVGAMVRGLKQDGWGVVIQADSKRLEGQWVRDVLHGRGSMTLADGLRYDGDWVNGALEGWGMLSKEKELLAVGQFLDGRPQGWMACRISCFEHYITQVSNNDVIVESLRVTDNKECEKREPNIECTEAAEIVDNAMSIEDVTIHHAFEPCEDMLFELDTIMTKPTPEEFALTSSTQEYLPRSSSLLERLCGTSGWISTWRYHSPTMDHHRVSLQLLKSPPSVEDIFLLNPRLWQQKPGLLQHTQQPSSQSLPVPPRWIEEIMISLKWTT